MLPRAQATDSWSRAVTDVGKAATRYFLVALAYTLLFWVFREQSYSGDWKHWIRFIEEGLWYRLREPACLVLYQIPYLVLRPLGVSAASVLAAASCVLGGVSFAYALASLRQLSSNSRFQLMGMAALTASYGVSGVFFGQSNTTA